MRIRIVCFGRTRNTFIRRGIEEYMKRIRSMCNVEVVELRTPPRHARPTRRSAEEELLSQRDRYFTVALDPSGQMLTSEELAQIFREHSNIAMVIGGPDGLPKELTQRCDMRLSLSRLTFTSELARLILIEQIYRALTIMAQHPYHK